MIDTVNLHINIKPPTEVTERIPERFLWQDITFNPVFTPRGFIRSYTGRLNNLYLTFNENGLYIGNSWHKYYHGKNWNDYTFTEIVATYNALNERFNGLIETAKIKRIDFGVNIKADPIQICGNWMYFRARSPLPMSYRNTVYGKRFIGTEYNFKGYNKTLEVKKQNYITLPDHITRVEKSVFRMRNLTHRKRNRIHLYTAKDLTNQSIIRQLAQDFLTTYQNIEKMSKVNFQELNTSQIKIVATMQNVAAREALRVNSNRTYKRYLSEYRKIVNRQKSENKTFGMIAEKITKLMET